MTWLIVAFQVVLSVANRANCFKSIDTVCGTSWRYSSILSCFCCCCFLRICLYRTSNLMTCSMCVVKLTFPPPAIKKACTSVKLPAICQLAASARQLPTPLPTPTPPPSTPSPTNDDDDKKRWKNSLRVMSFNQAFHHYKDAVPTFQPSASPTSIRPTLSPTPVPTQNSFWARQEKLKADRDKREEELKAALTALYPPKWTDKAQIFVDSIM